MGIELRCPAGHAFDPGDEAGGGVAICRECGVQVSLPDATRRGPPPLPNQATPRPAVESVTRPTVIGYQPEGLWRRRTVWLATGLLLVALFQALPLTSVRAWSTAPPWAQAVILLAGLEVAYAAWMLLVPDWSTVWVAMLMLTGVCVAYGAALGIAWVGPRGWPLPLGIDKVRGYCQPWCAAVIAVTFAQTYACGRVSRRWKKRVLARGEPEA